MTPLDFDLDALKAELAERSFRRLSGDGGRRPHWAVIAADERMEREFDLPPEPGLVAEADWQDEMVDSGRIDAPEDRTLTDELPPGYDPRVWRQSL